MIGRGNELFLIEKFISDWGWINREKLRDELWDGHSKILPYYRYIGLYWDLVAEGEEL
jgi:hypothetical protein